MSDRPYASARFYYELFDGFSCDDRITDLTMTMKIGGTEAPLAGDRYCVSVYGRRSINCLNLVTLHQERVDLPGVTPGTNRDAYWRTVNIDCENIDVDPVRCIVVKVESLTAQDVYAAQNTTYVPSYADQDYLADPPPWGIRVLKASIWASPLRRNLSPEAVIEHIASPWWSGERFFCPDSSGVEIDQLVYEDIPKTRLDAMLEVDEMLDWDIEATRDSFTYRKPVALGEARDDELYRISLADPHYTGSITPQMDECCNGVRVVYTNKNERPKEYIEWGESETLGDAKKAQVVELPFSIRSKKQAKAKAALYLASHLEPPIAGRASLVKTATVASGEDRDCLLVRPGELLQVTDAPRTFRRIEREISSVTLHPLTHTAEVELGPKSRRFDKWLARLAAKGKA